MNDPAEPLLQLRDSAREWHKIQVGVFGFVGLCGVLRDDSGPARPLWLQNLSGVAALAALIFAILAVTIIASIAYPLTVRPTSAAGGARRLHLGIVVTFIAVALTAGSALSMWWPEGNGKPMASQPQQVTVTTGSGSACGTVVDSAHGAVDLDIKGERVRVPLDRLVSINLVGKC
jgi:hypothetical protein